MKRKLMTVCVIVMLLALVSTGTLAYYTTYATSENIIAADGVDAVIYSVTDSGEIAQEAVICLPGGSVSRMVYVENAGNQPFYIRMSVEKYVLDTRESAENCLNLDLNTEKWILQDGYYYYTEALQPGQRTVPLFTRVEMDGFAVGNALEGKTLVLEVTGYAVQSRNNGDTVWVAAGWPMP